MRAVVGKYSPISLLSTLPIDKIPHHADFPTIILAVMISYRTFAGIHQKNKRMPYETLQKLPESHRKVFAKSFLEGKKQTEIAEEMNISAKSVNRYRQKTLEVLKEELKDYLPTLLLLTGCNW